jgi:hypothetical protein
MKTVNDAFHASYDAARVEISQEAVLLVVTVDALVVCRRDSEKTFPLPHGEFHAIKAIAHAPVGVYAALQATGDGKLGAPARKTLSTLQEGARATLDGLEGRADAFAGDARDLLQRTLTYVEAVLVRDRVACAHLEAFARDCGDLLLRLTMHATRAQLGALDAATRSALEMVSHDERGALHVVVTGDHQARTRSLAMQYFRKRLGERDGAEVRVMYGEGISTTAEARALVGTCRLNRQIAAAFFGDPARLQRDVLGDAAESLLAETNLAPLVT